MHVEREMKYYHKIGFFSEMTADKGFGYFFQYCNNEDLFTRYGQNK